MKKITWIVIILVILALGAYFVFAYDKNTAENPDLGDEEGVDRAFSGEVLEVDLSQMAFDGPAIVVLETSAGARATVAVPSMGLPLCEASESIESVSDIEVGDTVSVRGEIDSEGNIVPCSDSSHYLRIES